MNLSDDARLRYEQYLRAREAVDIAGEATRAELEELRSLSVELVVRLLADNPETFPEYAAHRERLRRRARGEHV